MLTYAERGLVYQAPGQRASEAAEWMLLRIFFPAQQDAILTT